MKFRLSGDSIGFGIFQVVLFFITFSYDNQQRRNIYSEDLSSLLRPSQPMKSFIFLKLFIFEKLLIFECSILEYIANIIFQQSTKRCFALYQNIQQISLFRNLLNVVLHFGCTKQWAKGKKGRTHTSEAKTREKQNSVTIMISADRKGTVFPVKLKLEGESCE